MESSRRWNKWLKLLLPATLFLFFPRIGFGDLPPVWIGILLMFPTVFTLSYCNEQMAESRKWFWKALLSGLLQSLISSWIRTNLPLTEEHPFEQPMAILVVSFSFALIDFLFLLPALKSFCDGILFLSGEEDTVTVQSFEKVKAGVARWMIISRIFWILPECSVLTSYEYHNENPLFRFDWYRFIQVFRAIGGGVSAVVCILFAVRFLQAVSSLLKNDAWQNRMTQRLESVLAQHPEKPLSDRLQIVLWLLSVSFLCLAGLKVNYLSLIPSYFSGILLLCGVFSIPKSDFSKKPIITVSAIAVAVGIVQTVLRKRYLTDYIPKDALYQNDAYESFLPIRILGAVEILLTFFAFLFLFRSIIRFIRSSVSVRFENDDGNASARATERAVKGLSKRFILPVLLLILSTVSSLLDCLTEPLFPWLPWVQTVLSIGNAIAFSGSLEELTEQIVFQIKKE